MKRLLLLCLMFLLTAGVSSAEVFNNVTLTNPELNADIDRAFAMGLTSGFSGIRPYSELDLLDVYHQTKDPYIYKYIWKDLGEVAATRGVAKQTSHFYIAPLSVTELRVYTLDTSVPNEKRYCVENMEGTCLKQGLNAYLDFAGEGRLLRNITFYYEGQLSYGDATQGLLKKAYIKAKTGPVTWEFGKDSLWIGQGYHGSFLLSDNAEPFLLFKMQVERPFDIPIQYTLFNGWLDDYDILGQRFAWKPFSFFEIGGNEVVRYRKSKGIKFWDWPHVLFNSSWGNYTTDKYYNPRMASLDAALYMPFLNKLPYLKGGKLYGEYGGIDTYGWWHKGQGWVGPLGFEFLGQGIMLGGLLTTGNTDFRYEYSENYESHPILWNWYGQVGVDYPSKGEIWYRKIPYEYNNALMGHVMGPEGEDSYFELKQRTGNFVFTGFYDRRRNHMYNKIDQYHIYETTPQIRHQYGLDVLYSWKKFEFDGTFIYNHYKNVNTNPNILESEHAYNIAVGEDAHEMITGFGIKYIW